MVVWAWILQNKTWLFSGAGIAVLAFARRAIWNMWSGGGKVAVGTPAAQPQINVNVSQIAPVVSAIQQSTSASESPAPTVLQKPQKRDGECQANVGSLRPEITTVSYDEESDVWRKGNGGSSFLTALLPFSNDAQHGKKTASLDDLRARLTYYEGDAVREFKRLDSGCWVGEAYRSTYLGVGDIVYLIAAIQIKGHACVVANPRQSAARYSEDRTLVDPLPAGTYEIKVDLIGGDGGEYAQTFWFRLDAGEQLKAGRISPHTASVG